MKAPIAVEMPLYQVRTPVQTPRLVRVKCFTLLWVGVFLQERMHAMYVAIYLRQINIVNLHNSNVLTVLGYKLSLRTHLVREES